jgi:hypothetical protein
LLARVADEAGADLDLIRKLMPMSRSDQQHEHWQNQQAWDQREAHGG